MRHATILLSIAGLLVPAVANRARAQDTATGDTPTEEAPPDGSTTDGGVVEGAPEDEANPSAPNPANATPAPAPVPQQPGIAPVPGAPAPAGEPTEETSASTTAPAGSAEVSVEASATAETEASATTEVEATHDGAGEADDEQDEFVPWAGSTFSWDQALSTNTLSKSAQLSYNPTYAWSFTLAPRWALNDQITLTLREDMDFELTRSDDRNSAHEVWLYDPQIGVAYANFYELEGVSFNASGRVGIPLSKTSRAANRVLSTRAGISAERSLKDAGLAQMSVNAAGSYSHHWATSNVASVENPYPCEIADGARGTDRVCGQAGGSSLTSDDFGLSLGADYQINDELTAGIGFGWRWRRGYGLADAVVPVATAPGGTITLEDGSDTHWRNGTSFGVEVGYTFAEWVSASFSFDTETSQLNPDGTRRNPFYNYDSMLSLSAAVVLDELYGAVRR